MELRRCGTSHFINVIRGGLVIKVCNIDSRRRLGLMFKKLEDIYEADFTRNLDRSSVFKLQNGCKNGGVIDHNIESPCLPMAERLTSEGDQEVDISNYSGNSDEINSDSDNFLLGEMTLKQLKKRCKTKKRKISDFFGSSSQQEFTEVKPEVDEDDLETPLSSWKSKLSKNAKSKKKGTKRSTSLTSTHALSIKTEQILFAEDFQQSTDISVPIALKVELPGLDYPEYEIINPVAGLFPIFDEHIISFDMNPRKLLQTDGTVLRNEETLSLTENFDTCVNEISYSQLDDVDPPPLLLPFSGENIELDTLETSRICSFSPVLELFEEANTKQSLDSQSFQQIDSSLGSHPCSTPLMESDAPTIEDKQKHDTADTAINILEADTHPTVMEEVNSPNEEKQLPIFVAANDNLASETNNYHDAEWLQPPERLPSARKTISPSSQEKLCLAMNSVEFCDDRDNYKCKGKLLFGKQLENTALLATSDSDNIKSSLKGEVLEQMTLTEAIVSPKKILKKPKHNKKSSLPRKGSPRKSRLEGPHLSRSLPRFSTRCTSIEGCYESAIAFSQRQMQDIESLATKLMAELKSMKSIVEEKVLYEALRSTSLKNDAEEVKMAIKNATKLEETTKRWLSMMARDCNRFCKIMRLTEDGSVATENVTQNQKERKKISFADEAGGMLCHVKVFENDLSSVEHKSNNQKMVAKEC